MPCAHVEEVPGAVVAGLLEPSIMASLMPPGLAVLMAEDEDMFSQSLMEKAGLEKPKDRRDDRRR